MNLNKAYLIIGGLVVFCLILFINQCKEPKKSEPPKADTVKVVTTVEKPITIIKWKAKLDSIPYPVYINRTDTVWGKLQVASVDTLIKKDSSWIKIKYLFPPANHFDVDMRIKEKQIFTTITKEIPKVESFWNRFGYSIQGGFGYGLINKQFDVYIGIGVHVRIK